MKGQSKKADIWMPLFISDYLADTSHLSAAEHGAYLLMIMHAWMNGGALPAGDDRLRRVARMDAKEWNEARSELIGYFYAADDGSLRHRRIDDELVRSNANIDQRSKAGKASALVRKQKKEAEQAAQRNGNESSTSVATHVQREPQREGERDSQRNGKPPPPPTKNQGGGITTDGGCARDDAPRGRVR
ncbi:DUF1376 domain-containing protein [Paraburkholderia sp. BL10I2N1]|uniref:YdaU family protein n=1 Tax=Paraburkholderia sp. BL10I2N1 TaxID=1938796 RepID=UPI00105E4267|nr:DUF1376 domain-containing protein [Paraburkholderia sp. BL10I2N1]TDN63229.1 uncharacterized protein YdaU (DUF1376 family) [Paraburkholderia sp. BL10I2N1]